MTKTKIQRRKPTVSIIGAGRLGQALAVALHSLGYPILALVAQHRQKVEKATALMTNPGIDPLALGSKQLQKLPQTDLIVIATPDDVIAATAGKLATCLEWRSVQTTALHTSGALSSEVLAPLAKAGFETGSIHPLVSISEPMSGSEALRGAFYCLEGTKEATALAGLLVADLGGHSFSIKPENKALYHAAAVMASPHVTALLDLAAETLAACGLSKPTARKVLVPLLESTVNNLKTSTPQKALTGTFARGDVATVREHLRALSGRELGAALKVYRLLGLHSIQLAEKN